MIFRARVVGAVFGLAFGLVACLDDGGDLLEPDASLDAGAADRSDAEVADAGAAGGIDVGDVGPALECNVYRAALTFTGDATGALTWTVTDGALPPGIGLDPRSGVLSGRPTAAGRFSATVTVLDGDNTSWSSAVGIEVSPSTPTARWALLADDGAGAGPADDEVSLLDVCGPEPGRTVSLARGFASLAYTGRDAREHNAYSRGADRVAIHVGTYDPLDLETLVFDLPETADGAPQQRLRTDGLFVSFSPPGDRLLVVTTSEGRALDLVVHTIPAAGPAEVLARLGACADACPVAWSPAGDALVTVDAGRLRVVWLDLGTETTVDLGAQTRNVAFAADGQSVWAWGPEGAFRVRVGLAGSLEPPEVVPPILDVALDPARATHPISRVVGVEGGALWTRALDDGSDEAQEVLQLPEGDWAVSLGPTGRRLLFVDPEVPRASIVELEAGRALVAFDLALTQGPAGARPFRFPDLEEVVLQWRPDGDRVLFTGEYEGCGCEGGSSPCPKVAMTAVRVDDGWRLEPELDVDAAGLEAECQARGAFSLVAQGSLSIPPTGRFLAVSRIDLAFYEPSQDGLQVYSRIFEGRTTFFGPDRWTPDGAVFVDREVYQFLGGPTAVAPAALPGTRITGVVPPPLR